MISIKTIAEEANVSPTTVSRVINNNGSVKEATRVKVLNVIERLKSEEEVVPNKVTINDVARIAGVSKTTVSRVLNDDELVVPATKEHVKNVMRDLNYSPNMNARYLRRNKTKLIGVVIPDIANPIFGKIVKAIESVAEVNDYSVVLFNTSFNFDRIKEILKVLEDRRADGLIYMTGKLDPRENNLLKKCPFPIVQIFRDPDENILDFPNINIDNYQAAYDMTCYLIQRGYRDIGFIGGSPLDSSPFKRFEAYLQALHDYSIVENTNWIHEGEYTFASGYEVMKRILENGEYPKAVFAANDEMAIGAMRAIAEYGLRVPEDIAAVGFDDIEFSKYTTPSLTTIKQPIYELGIRGIEMLISLMNDKQIENKNITLDYELVIRESS